jgi:plasmid stability protein
MVQGRKSGRGLVTTGSPGEAVSGAGGLAAPLPAFDVNDPAIGSERWALAFACNHRDCVAGACATGARIPALAMRIGMHYDCYQCYQSWGLAMSQLLVRDLDEKIVTALRQRAAENGRSAEAEHREILKTHLAQAPQPRAFKDVLAAMPWFGDDELFDLR